MTFCKKITQGQGTKCDTASEEEKTELCDRYNCHPIDFKILAFLKGAGSEIY